MSDKIVMGLRPGLRAALKGAQAGAWTIDLVSEEAAWNDDGKRLLGLHPDAAISLADIKSRLTTIDVARFERYLDQLKNGNSHNFNTRITWPDRSRHWIRMLGGIAAEDFAEGGHVASGIVVAVETPLYTPEPDSDEDRLRQLLATLDLGAAMVLDFSGAIRVWSRGCERLYGWTTNQAIGQRAHELLQTAFPAPLAEIEDILLHDGEWHGDLRHRTRDGDQLIVVAHQALRRDAQGHPVAVLVNLVDITHQRDIEARLAQSQKMEAVGQLTGGFAHDFNNVLLAVGLSLEMIEDEQNIDENSSLHQVLDGAKHATEQARTLIAQLLAFGRRQALTPNPLDVNVAVISVARMLRRTLAANIMIDCVLLPDLWVAFADGPQFETALLNLAINARDAMPNGGKLLIETVNQPLVGAFAQTFDVTPGDYCRASSVSDTGAGMSSEIVALRAFEPFFTTKPAQQGTGLGLSQVYGFMKQTGGHVTLQSKVGQGTRLVLYLPRSHDAVVAAPAKPARNTAPGAGEDILIVEDNMVVRDAVAHVLTGLGYRVRTATTGDEALAILRSDAPIDLLFTDMVLPGELVGDRLAQLARQLRPRLRILLTSGYSQSLAQADTKDEERIDLIAKPYTTAELAERIRQALATPRTNA